MSTLSIRALRLILIGALLLAGPALSIAQQSQFALGRPSVTNGTLLSLVVPLRNSGFRSVSGVQVQEVTLAGTNALSPPLPLTLGNMAANASVSIPLTFDNGGFTAGNRYLLTMRGSYLLDGSPLGFTANVFVIVPGGASDATLTVRTFQQDDSAPDNKGAPAGAGVTIRVNDQTVGMTDDSGTLTIQTSPGRIHVTALVPSSAEGSADITLPAGQPTTVDVVLDDSKEVVENSLLISPDIVNGLLDAAFPMFRMQFQRAFVPVILKRLDQVELVDPNGGRSTFLENFFGLLPDGTIAANDLNAVRATFLAQTGKITLRIVATDQDGFTHSGTSNFFLGRYRVAGRLLAPPSNPSLVVSNIQVVATVMGGDSAVTTSSDDSGMFQFAQQLPGGMLLLKAEAFQDNTHYYGQARFALTADRTVNITLRSTQDLIDHVPPFAASAQFVSPVSEVNRVARQSQPSTSLLPRLAPTADSVTATATAAAQDAVISDTATLTVPQGTQKVILNYLVHTDEYPVYVKMQSQFNDLWSLNVTAGSSGVQLFEIARNVNSQLFIDPIWQSDGSTGQIQMELDVSTLAATQDTTVTIYVDTTNIGDSVLPTTVIGTLSLGVDVTINTLTRDSIDTHNDGTYYSIPQTGETNTFSRAFVVNFTAPSSATIKNVSVKLRSDSGAELAGIVDAGPGDPSWTLISSDSFRVRVTFTDPSPVNGVPPPAHLTEYRFGLTVTDNGVDTPATPKDSNTSHALWRMPSGIPRYGIRDVGGDDWCSRSTYSWIEQEASLLTRVDDISGEHGKNIGHNTHERGTDIDIFHFAGNGASGGAVYTALAQDVLDALQGNAAAKTRVTTWANASRNGLNALLADGSVNFLYYAIGSAAANAGASVADGWAQSLLRIGQTSGIVDGQPTTLDLGIGTWVNASNGKMHFNAVHNSHIHIALIETGG